MSDALQFLILTTAGWLNRQQEDAIDFLREESRVLRERLDNKRIRFTDGQRRRLAVRGKKLGRKVLAGLAGIATPGHDPALVPQTDRRKIWRKRPERSG